MYIRIRTVTESWGIRRAHVLGDEGGEAMKAAYDGAENPWQTVRCIVFDAYGTLISTGNGSLQAAREILTQAGRKDIPAEGFYADWKRCHRQHIRDMREFINEEAVFRQDLKKLYLQYQISVVNRKIQVFQDMNITIYGLIRSGQIFDF